MHLLDEHQRGVALGIDALDRIHDDEDAHLRRAPLVSGSRLGRQEVLEAVLAQAVVERRAVDAERARGAGDVALVALDGGDDLVLLLLVQARLQRLRPAAVQAPTAACRAAGVGSGALAPGPRRPKSRSAAVTSAPRRDDDGALDHVLQLAHVARPGVLPRARPAPTASKPRTALAGGAVELGDEVLDQARQILEAIAQRRQRDREDVEPVVEILAELALGDQLLEVAVGRRDHAHVDVDGLGAADALELALLQHAQELDLHLQRQVAALVEEQRAAVGQLEAPGAPRHRAGEGALLVAEQLALEHARRQRRAVDAHERLAPRAAS